MFKRLGRDKVLLLLAVVGFFILMFDQNISMGRINPYPAYETDAGYSLEFQVYSLNYMYGAWCDTSEIDGMFAGDVYYQLTLDIVPDLLGFIILAVVLKKMSGLSRLFGIASFMSWFGTGLYVFIHLMPFIFNGIILSYMCFWLAIAILGVEIIIGYVFVCGLCDILSGYEHRSSRRAIAMSWFGTAILSIVVCILRWVAVISPALVVVYEMLQLGINALYYYFIYRDRDFIVGKKALGANV